MLNLTLRRENNMEIEVKKEKDGLVKSCPFRHDSSDECTVNGSGVYCDEKGRYCYPPTDCPLTKEIVTVEMRGGE